MDDTNLRKKEKSYFLRWRKTSLLKKITFTPCLLSHLLFSSVFTLFFKWIFHGTFFSMHMDHQETRYDTVSHDVLFLDLFRFQNKMMTSYKMSYSFMKLLSLSYLYEHTRKKWSNPIIVAFVYSMLQQQQTFYSNHVHIFFMIRLFSNKGTRVYYQKLVLYDFPFSFLLRLKKAKRNHNRESFVTFLIMISFLFCCLFISQYIYVVALVHLPTNIFQELKYINHHSNQERNAKYKK